jgi:hypothetical protein
MGRGVWGVLLASGLAVGILASSPMRAEKAKEPMLAHMVYFSLKDASPEKQEQLVASCHQYLTGHDGEVFYAAGTLAKDLNRPVNDQGFDVALQIVFDGKAAHDKYQDHPRHLDFIKANQPNIAKVRVFDSYVNRP